MLKKYISFLILLLLSECLIAQVPTVISFSPTTAGPGDTITITGTNFTPLSYPIIGSNDAVNVFISSTTLLAVIGTNFTSGSVTVTSFHGSTSNSLPGFVFNALPVITSFSPITAGPGDTVIITGKYLAPGLTPPTINFGGVSASSIIPISISVVKAVLGNGASGNIMLETAFGSISYPGFAYNPVNFSALPSEGCFPLSVSFTNLSVGNWITWHWDFGNGLASVLENPTCTYSNPGVYTVKLIGVSSTDILDTVTKVNYITVYNRPTVSFISGAQNAFVDAITTYTTQGNQSNYQWTLSDTVNTGYIIISGGTATDSSISIKWLKTGSKTINVNYYNSNGCSGNVATVNTSVTIASAPIIISFLPTIATIGTTVIIKGQYFTGATAVSFGGVAAQSFSVLTDSTISAIIGAGATGSISVATFVDSTKIPGFTFIPPLVPTITSFSPTAGPVGTTVTITGTNFNSTAANNIVYFGAVKAVVTNANANTLIVTVPVSATYQPIIVTSGGLTAYSTKPFIVTFNNAVGGNITASSFSKVDFASTSALSEAIGDIDGDGKLDIVSTGTGGILSVLKNTSTPGKLFFSTSIDFTENIPLGVPVIADIDGDGKLDIITANYSNNTVSVFRNTSTPGNISFAARVDIPTKKLPNIVAVGDIDGDGKPDLVVGNAYEYYDTTTSNSISVFRNISTPGNITTSSFVAGVDFLYTLSWYYGTPQIVIQDIDGDLKPDIIVGDGQSNISLFHNIASQGSITSSSLAQVVNVPGASAYILTADIDNDGKPDLVTGYPGDNRIYALKNTTMLDSINSSSFAGIVTFPNFNDPRSMAIADINGDGKPDLAVAGDTGIITIQRNTTVSGSITNTSFTPVQIYNFLTPYNYYPLLGGINISDLDGDGKPDISLADTSSRIAIFRNQIGEPVPTQLCPPVGSTNISSSISGSVYQWQLSIDSINFNNINNNTNYSGVNSDTLQLNNIPSSWYGNQYRCVVDGNNSHVYTLLFIDTWIGTTDSTWENPANWSCDAVPDINTDVIINSGTVVLGSNTAVRSLTVSPNAKFIIATGNNLIVTH